MFVRSRPQGELGSPPQVRGKHLRTKFPREADGITPAGAGKTRPQQRVQCPRRDHPRRCGENLPITGWTSRTRGSPPQVRGKHVKNIYDEVVTRITPAGAGKTGHIHRIRLRNRDHPRRCGENFCPRQSMLAIMGSPPQVRGKPPEKLPESLIKRITPAGAGKTQEENANYNSR